MKYLSDQQLLALYKRGHNQAFTELYRRNVELVYRFVYGRTLDKQLTEEIVSDTFFTLIEVLANYEGKGKLSSYIIGIALNKLRQKWDNRQTPKNVSLNEEYLADVTYEENAEEVETEIKLIKELKIVLRRLPDRYRSVLVMRFLELKPLKQVALELGVSLSNVTTIQNRALAKARNIAQELLAKKYENSN